MARNSRQYIMNLIKEGADILDMKRGFYLNKEGEQVHLTKGLTVWAKRIAKEIWCPDAS